jgi:hypothetical protein
MHFCWKIGGAGQWKCIVAGMGRSRAMKMGEEMNMLLDQLSIGTVKKDHENLFKISNVNSYVYLHLVLLCAL